jgi:hypothetical protein
MARIEPQKLDMFIRSREQKFSVTLGGCLRVPFHKYEFQVQTAENASSKNSLHACFQWHN